MGLLDTIKSWLGLGGGSDPQPMNMSQGGSPTIDLRSACVVQYKMNDTSGTTVVNSVGSPNGTSANPVTPVAGVIGGALAFNGTSDYVDVGDTFNSVFSNPFSISMWVNLVDGQPSGQPGGENAIFGILNYGDFAGVEIWNWGSGVIATTYSSASGAGVTDSGIDNLLPNGQTGWFHIVWTVYINAGRIKSTRYFNNTQNVRTRTGSSASVMPTIVLEANPYIGACLESPIYYTAGAIDNVCIFNKALSTDEIAFLYNNGDGTEDLSNSGGAIVIASRRGPMGRRR
jgi:Concanavalin A-like lectin/glucanases superfamily